MYYTTPFAPVATTGPARQTDIFDFAKLHDSSGVWYNRRMKSKSVLVSLDPFSLPRLEAILAYAREHGWGVILEDRLPEGGLDRIDGALVSLRGRKEQLAKVKALQRRDKPVIDLTIACPRVKLPRVISDHKALGELAARHFLERGFASFAWYASGTSHVHDLRFHGFRKVLKGLPVHKLSTLNSQLLSLPRPLAVLAYDESDAARAITACHHLKLDVPGDVAVLGIGNDPFLCENGVIPISSVDQGLAAAAREACALLESLMTVSSNGNRKDNQTILIPPVGIISRASTDTLAHPDPTIRAALVYIHHHLDRAFGAAETAEAIGIPRSTLDHRFIEKVGHPIGREILNQRLLRAKRLLKDKSVKLNAIARACGFCNASYFTNTFRHETGLSPKVWRRGNGNF